MARQRLVSSLILTASSLWKVQQAIDTINQTYEVSRDLEAYNYRAGVIFTELREQVERYACSGGVWTQTTDVEGEVNGLYTYDRRVLRPDVRQWREDIERLYRAAEARGVVEDEARGVANEEARGVADEETREVAEDEEGRGVADDEAKGVADEEARGVAEDED